MNELIDHRLQVLEEKISFQEDAVQKIEAELIFHQKKVNLLEKMVEGLQLSLRKIENNTGTEKQEDLPPHF
ncbi:MAG: SlyX family protein [Pseudomonadota bacterium]|nr:SlyX family protein [Pseudomonadota bacterium]